MDRVYLLLCIIWILLIQKIYMLQIGCNQPLIDDETQCYNQSGIKRCYYICSNGEPLKWEEAKTKCENHSSGSMELAQDDSAKSHEIISELFIGGARLSDGYGPVESTKEKDEAWLNGIYRHKDWCWLYSTGMCIPIKPKHYWGEGSSRSPGGGRSRSPGLPIDDAMTIVKEGEDVYWNHHQSDRKGHITKYICVKKVLPPTEAVIHDDQTTITMKILPNEYNVTTNEGNDTYQSKRHLPTAISVTAGVISIICIVVLLIKCAISNRRRFAGNTRDTTGENTEKGPEDEPVISVLPDTKPELNKNNSLDDTNMRSRSLPAIPANRTREKTAKIQLMSKYSVQEVQELKQEVDRQSVRIIYCTSKDVPDLIPSADSGQLVVREQVYEVLPDEKTVSRSSDHYEILEDLKYEEDDDDDFVIVENDLYSHGNAEEFETRL